MQGIVDCCSVQVLNEAERLERQVSESNEFCRLVQRNLEPVRTVQSDESQSTPTGFKRNHSCGNLKLT